jgi:carboxymethylenebutenolidase
MTELNWMQTYAASEMVELGREGQLSRREVLVRLAAICGSAGGAAAFLAACGDDKPSKSAAPKPAAKTTTTASSTEAVAPPTTGGTGHILSVAADDPDVQARDVTFPGPASTMLGYVARPAGDGKRPGVLVIHEIFGLTDHIRDVARRLAKVGFLAVAPDLASRSGGTEKAGSDTIGAVTRGSVEDRVADLNAGVDYIEAQKDYNGKLGVVGFCFGGGMTLSLAAAQPKVLAAVPYYGPTPQPPSVMTATKAAILANYGATDTRVDAGIPDLEAALKGKVFEKRLYAGAGHAFNNDTNGGAYNEAAALKAWSATIDWLRKYLA